MKGTDKGKLMEQQRITDRALLDKLYSQLLFGSEIINSFTILS